MPPLNDHPNAHPDAAVYTNAAQIATALRTVGTRQGRKSAALVRHYSMLLETRIKARASGRPGPRVITGDYRRSWNTRFAMGTDVFTGTVGTDRPQARRLEYGFVGADRIGRVFHQPPFPHVGPAVSQTDPEFTEAMARSVTWDG